MKNPFPPRDIPQFIPYKPGLERGFAIWRGHEYVVIRKEDLEPGDGLHAGDFGISDDDWMFAIRDPQHVAVARVSSCALNGRLLRKPSEVRKEVTEIWGVKKGPQVLRAPLDFCASYPTTAEQVRVGPNEGVCGFGAHGGRCFPGALTILGGEPIVHGLDTVFMEGPPAWWIGNKDVVREHLLAFTDIWEKLEGWFLEQREESRKAVRALPQRCEHCHGTGTVPHVSDHGEASAGFNEW
jgi:hypothetical protein